MFLPKDRAPEYLRLRIDDKKSFDELLKFPSYIYLDTVSDCNASCRMCVFSHNKSRFMSDKLFEKAAEEIINNKKYIKFVVVQGRGEPLLDPNIAERVAIFSKENGIPTFMSTNAELLDEDTAIKLLKANIGTIIMSIDSLNKNIYQKIRRGLNFQKVLTNILRFLELRDKINPTTQARIRMIEQKYNKGEWNEFEKFWRPKLKQPQDRITIKKIHAWGGKLNINDVKNIVTDQDYFPCVALWSFFSILSDGSVPLCPGDGALGKYTMGNFYESSIKELWINNKWNYYRNAHLTGNKIPEKMCKNCRMLEEPSDFEHIGKKIFPELYKE